MQIKIKSQVNFNDKSIIYLSEDKNVLEVLIGENVNDKKDALIKVRFVDVIGYTRTCYSGVQGLIQETEENEFMTEMLKLNHDPIKGVPEDHPYKRFVFYGYEDKNFNYGDPSLEIIAAEVNIEVLDK